MSLCKSRCCNQQSVGKGPFSGLSLCQDHLDKDIALVNKKKAKLMDKLQFVIDSDHRSLLRAEQSSLEDELQEVSDAFDELLEQVRQWRERIMSKLQAAHDSVSERLKDAAEAEDCSRKLSEASEAGNWKQVIEMTMSLRLWADEAFERSEKFDKHRSELSQLIGKTPVEVVEESLNNFTSPASIHDAEMTTGEDLPDQETVQSGDDDDRQFGKFSVRSIGDVSSGVRNMQFVMERHMNDVIQRCCHELEDAKLFDKNVRLPICKSHASIEDLPGEPGHLAVCTNTAGFSIDKSGYVTRTNARDKRSVPLPQPCIFISFYIPSEDDPEDYPLVDHIVGADVDGSVTFKFRLDADFNWKEGVYGLHCDSQRQLLYVAQETFVLVADLSGKVSQSISLKDIPTLSGEIIEIDGNADKLFILCENGGVGVVCKQSYESTSVVTLSDCVSQNLRSLKVFGSRLYFIDGEHERLHCASSISGQLLNSYPCKLGPRFAIINEFVMDERSLLFVSYDSNVVQVMDFSGNVLQILGNNNQVGSDEVAFNFPDDLLLIEVASGKKRLVVAEVYGRRLRVFELM